MWYDDDDDDDDSDGDNDNDGEEWIPDNFWQVHILCQ